MSIEAKKLKTAESRNNMVCYTGQNNQLLPVEVSEITSYSAIHVKIEVETVRISSKQFMAVIWMDDFVIVETFPVNNSYFLCGYDKTLLRCKASKSSPSWEHFTQSWQLLSARVVLYIGIYWKTGTRFIMSNCHFYLCLGSL